LNDPEARSRLAAAEDAQALVSLVVDLGARFNLSVTREEVERFVQPPRRYEWRLG
jgi:hypothetical protein